MTGHIPMWLRYVGHVLHRIHKATRLFTLGWAGIEMLTRLHWINLEEMAHDSRAIPVVEWVVNLLHLIPH
jgi:hypothetical protein